MRNRFTKLTNKYILKDKINDNLKECSIFTGIDYPHSHKHLVFDYETIFPLKKISFEDILFDCPQDFNKFLTLEFGNYMTLPEDCYPCHTMIGDKELEEKLDKFLI